MFRGFKVSRCLDQNRSGLQRFDQTIEKPKNISTVPINNTEFLIRQIAEFVSDLELSCNFQQRASSVAQKLLELASSHPSLTFGDVGGDGNSRPPEL